MDATEQDVEQAHVEVMTDKHNRHKEKMRRYQDTAAVQNRSLVRRLAVYVFFLGIGVTAAVASCQWAVMSDRCTACLNTLPDCEDSMWDGDEVPACIQLRHDEQAQCIRLCTGEPVAESEPEYTPDPEPDFIPEPDLIPRFEPEPGYKGPKGDE